ncbi:MAG: hemolysin activation/secretion protein [Akkermansiaceae bacterium]|jgi:hemolysin activation/secretion protein
MKLPALCLALITGAQALPVRLACGEAPVPDRENLIVLLESARDADSAADLLLQHYQKHGYPAVGVDIEDIAGKRRVTIDVSRLQNIWLGDGPARTKMVATKHFGELGGSFVRMSNMQDLLASFHANPLHRAIPRLQPAPDGASVNVLLQIDQSHSQRFSAGYLDTGASPLPRERFWIQGEFADFWQSNSLSTARLTLSPDPADFHAVQLGTRFFKNHGSELSFSLSYSGAQASTFDAYTWQVGGQWRSPESDWQGWTHRHSLGLSFRRSNNALEFGDATNRGLANVVQLSLGGTLEKERPESLTRAAASLLLSPFGDDDAHDSLRPGASGEYGILRTSIWHRQDLPAGWDLIANLGGQWASNPVLQADQFALGGAAGLRGLPEQFALGDRGYLGGLELRTPVFNLFKNWAFRPSLFLQAGETFDKVSNTSSTAVTSGLGLQIGQDTHLRASLHAGWRLDEGGSEIHSQLTWKF